MNKQRYAINCLLVLLLLVSQWAYAAHDAESLDGNHHHSADCIVCFSEQQSLGCSTAEFFSFDSVTNDSFISYKTITFAALFPRNQAIRAPPVIS